MTLYTVRRYLGIGVDEWEKLPWWQQKLYLDGLTEEFFSDEDRGYGETGNVSEIDLDDDPGALAQFGMQMQAV